MRHKVLKSFSEDFEETKRFLCLEWRGLDWIGSERSIIQKPARFAVGKSSIIEQYVLIRNCLIRNTCEIIGFLTTSFAERS